MLQKNKPYQIIWVISNLEYAAILDSCSYDTKKNINILMHFTRKQNTMKQEKPRSRITLQQFA